MKRTLLSILSSLAVCTASAFSPHVTNFGAEHYHAAAQNWDITVLNGDMVIFVNNEGLLANNRGEWQLTGIPGNSKFRSIYWAGDKRLYYGSRGDFGCVYVADGEIVFESFAGSFPASFQSSVVKSISSLNDIFYLNDGHNIYRYDLRNGNVSVIDYGDHIDFLGEVNGGVVFSIRGKGLYMQTNSCQLPLPGTEAVSGRKVVDVLPYKDGSLILVAADAAFLYSDGVCRQISDIFPSEATSAAICGNLVAIGTFDRGVMVYDTNTRRLDGLDTSKGMLCGDMVRDLEFDGNGNIWVSLSQGIAYVDYLDFVENAFGNSDRIGACYDLEEFNNAIWYATEMGLWSSIIPPDDGSLPDITHYEDLGTMYVHKFLKHDGKLFICHETGMHYLTEKNELVCIDGIEDCFGVCVQEDEPDVLLVNDKDGFLLVIKDQDGVWRMQNRIAGFDGIGGEYAFLPDGSIVYSNTVDKLFRLVMDEQCSSFVKVEADCAERGFPSEKISRIYSWQGHIICSTGKGFYEFDGNTAKETAFLNKFIDIIPEDASVFKTERGVYILCEKDLNLVCFPNEGGEYRVVIAENRYPIHGIRAMLQLPNNRLLVNYDDGVFTVNLDKLKHYNPDKYTQLSLRGINSMGRNKDVYYLAKRAEDGPYSYQPVTLPYKGRYFKADIAISGMESAKSYRIRHKIEGHDKDWTEGEVFYSKLPVGSYVYKVEAVHVGGTEVKSFSIPIIIDKPLILSAKMVVLYILLVPLIVFLLLKLYFKPVADNYTEEIKRRKALGELKIDEDLDNIAELLRSKRTRKAEIMDVIMSIKEKLSDFTKNN